MFRPLSWIRKLFQWRNGKIRSELAAKAAVVLSNYVWSWDSLAPAQRQFLQSWTVEFSLRKNWEGCGGLRLDDEMKLAIAGQVGLMVMGWERPFYFDHVKTILIYPTAFVAPRKIPMGAGTHLETEQALEGEAWYGGPVIVSWSDVVEPNRGTPHNLVIHEFAHQLDMLNGESADGLPPLPNMERIDRWEETLDETMDSLRANCRARLPTILDCYGCTSRSELFAVGCEAFFEAGHYLAEDYPPFYLQLSEFFQIDSRNWLVE